MSTTVAQVNIFSPQGIEKRKVRFNNERSLPEEDLIKAQIDKITNLIFDFTKNNLPKNGGFLNSLIRFFRSDETRFVTGEVISLPVDSGGHTACSFLEYGFISHENENRLLLALTREMDPGTDTGFFQFIHCPSKTNTKFKEKIKEGIENIASNGSEALWKRYFLRHAFKDSQKLKTEEDLF